MVYRSNSRKHLLGQNKCTKELKSFMLSPLQAIFIAQISTGSKFDDGTRGMRKNVLERLLYISVKRVDKASQPFLTLPCYGGGWKFTQQFDRPV